MRLRVAMWVLFGGYALQLLILTHLPGSPQALAGVSDKKLHFVAYLVLGALGFSAAALTFPRQRGLVSLSIFCGGLFAMVDETTQPLFNRVADVHDWGADVLGLVAATWFLGLIRMVSLRGASAKTPREAAS